MRIVLTGGAGFIGTHILVAALDANHEVLIVDNFVNSSPKSLAALKGMGYSKFDFVEADLCDTPKIEEAFLAFKPDIVIHLAGLKAVGESVEKPLMYYEQNILSTTSLLKAMQTSGCFNIVFSSSATVYGDPQVLPLDESHGMAPTNPYGKTKYFIEEILKDWCKANEKARSICLRYFNPVGAHESGEIGEDPRGVPNNLMPYIAQVAAGKREFLSVYGDDYDTKDGTGVRDYIHVCDLAEAHIAAVENIEKINGWEPINVGTGEGYSVLEMRNAYLRACNQKIDYKIAPRREGDIGTCYAKADKANTLLNWKAKRDLEEMCNSSWQFQSKHPNGYE
ncbi:MAG: UDP-glucose 4-epimerase GalE [Nitratireductor sp.]